MNHNCFNLRPEFWETLFLTGFGQLLFDVFTVMPDIKLVTGIFRLFLREQRTCLCLLVVKEAISTELSSNRCRTYFNPRNFTFADAPVKSTGKYGNQLSFLFHYLWLCTYRVLHYNLGNHICHFPKSRFLYVPVHHHKKVTFAQWYSDGLQEQHLLDFAECFMSEKWDRSRSHHFANSFKGPHWQDDRCNQWNALSCHTLSFGCECDEYLCFSSNKTFTIIFVPLWNILLILADW